MTAHVLINGVEADTVHHSDRGFQYGDGVFETIAVINGVFLLWDAHMARLQEGCQRLKIPLPDADLLWVEANQLWHDGAVVMTRGILKIIITRGPGQRGYGVPSQVTATRLISLTDWPDTLIPLSSRPCTVRCCQTRLGLNPQLAGIKHCNRLENILARAEWDDQAIVEGLLFDNDDQLIEGTMSNVFLVREQCLSTSALDKVGVAGVMRAHVLEIAKKLGIKTHVGAISCSELNQANEVFLTNSLIGIWPVASIVQHGQKKMLTTHALTQVLQQQLKPLFGQND